jgi:hypothetical protein
MPTFQFEAMDASGQEIRDVIEAASQDEAQATIRQMGYFVTKLSVKKARKGSGEKKVAQKKGKTFALGGVNQKTLTTFTRQLAILQDAGLPILRSLKILEGHPKPFDKAATARVMDTMVAQTLGEIRYVERAGGLRLVGKLHRLRRHYHRQWLRRRTRYWPAPLAPGFPYESGLRGDPESAPGQLAATISIARQLLTETALVTAREKLRRVQNPIGLVLAEHLLADDRTEQRQAGLALERIRGRRVARRYRHGRKTQHQRTPREYRSRHSGNVAAQAGAAVEAVSPPLVNASEMVMATAARR